MRLHMSPRLPATGVVRWPRRVEAGSECDAPVGQVDLLASLADLLPSDSFQPVHGDGSSFLPELLGESRLRPPLMHHGRGRFAIREGPWKLVFSPNGRALGEPAELYDLGADSAEERNLLEEEPGVVDRLAQQAAELGP